MTIIASVLHAVLGPPDPTPWVGAEAWDWPRSRPQLPTPTQSRSAVDLTGLHAYQASPRGLIEGHVYDLATSTAALVQYAAHSESRPLVANATKDLETAAARLAFVLQLLADERRP